jgi:hypothetical protein
MSTAVRTPTRDRDRDVEIRAAVGHVDGPADVVADEHVALDRANARAVARVASPRSWHKTDR